MDRSLTVSRLVATDVTKRFGGLSAVSGVSLEVVAGRVHLLIGPNGAGKTTFFNVVSGVDVPSEGTVVLDGRDLTGAAAHVYARAGLMRTFQHARPFGGLTVAENVMVGAHVRSASGPLRGTVRTPDARREERHLRHVARELLDRVGLHGRADHLAADLTLAEERRLEVARCLAGQPSVLLLDEPLAGLGEEEAAELGRLVRGLATEEGVAVVLIEHHLDLALSLADEVTVLDFGVVIASGEPEVVSEDPRVVDAYVGGVTT